MYTGLESIDRLYLVLAFSFVARTKVVTLDVGLATLASLFLSSFLPGAMAFTITERSVLKLIATKKTQGQVFENKTVYEAK